MIWYEDPYWEGRCLVCGWLLTKHKDGKCPRPQSTFAQPVGIKTPNIIEFLWELPEVIYNRFTYCLRKRFSGKSNDPAPSSAEDAEADAELGNA